MMEESTATDSILKNFLENEGDFLQQVALLIWLHKGEDYGALYDVVTGVKTWFEMMKHFENNEGLAALKSGVIGWLFTGVGTEEEGLILEAATSSHLLHELKQRLTKEDEIETLRNQTVMAIAEYVKDNPNADEDTVREVVLKYVNYFANQVQNL